MKKLTILTLMITLLLTSFILPVSAQESWETWDPDLTSQGVAITEPFESYLYDPTVIHGGTFVMATPSDPPEQHQWNAGATASYEFLDPFNDYLTRTDPITGAVVPWIAESWEVSEDKLSYTVHLAQGVKFHDGTELTSEDVKWCFDFIMENNFTRMADVWQILSRDEPTEIVDEYTLRFHLNEPFVSFARETLGTPYIYPKNIWEEIAADPNFDWLTFVPSLEQQIGCGPYKVVEYVPNSYIKYEAFEDYWHGKPYIDEFLRPIITSGDAELLALRRGEVDVFNGFLSSEAIPALLREEGIGLYIYNNQYMYHWGYNMYKWPFNVKEFRYACAHAIDKQDIVDTLLLGYGIPGPTGVEAPFYTYWYNPDTPETYSFNLTKAEEILDDLGYIDTDGDGVREGSGEHAGEPIEFDIGPPIYDPVRVRAAELIAENLNQIGIKATVQYLEWTTLWNKIIQPLDSPTKVDSWLLGSSQSVDPQWFRVRLHSSAIPNPNYYGFVNAEFDQLAELQGSQFVTSERRESVYRMQEILADEIPLIVLYFRQSPSVYRTGELTGWIDHYGAGRGHFWDYISLRTTALQTLKPVNIAVVDSPPPEVEIGDTFKLGLKFTGPEGEVLTDISVSVLLSGDPTSYEMEHVGEGVYEKTFDTSEWFEGEYTIKVDARETGYIDTTTSFAMEAVEPAPPTPEPTPSFWESYGATVTGVIIVLAIVAIVAVYRLSKK